MAAAMHLGREDSTSRQTEYVCYREERRSTGREEQLSLQLVGYLAREVADLRDEFRKDILPPRSYAEAVLHVQTSRIVTPRDGSSRSSP